MERKPHSEEYFNRSPALESCVEDEVLEWYLMSPEERPSPSPAQVEFWLRELRTPEIVLEVVSRFPAEARLAAPLRPAVEAALRQDRSGIEQSLAVEEAQERQADRAYWEPLRQELERQTRKAASSIAACRPYRGRRRWFQRLLDADPLEAVRKLGGADFTPIAHDDSSVSDPRPEVVARRHSAGCGRGRLRRGDMPRL